jgi:SNF2 family DNA or RNA helicase
MTKIIDNSQEKLASCLKNEFHDKEEIAIASAYFNVNGYRELKEGLQDKPLRLMLGREPTESIKWEEEILNELEEQEDNPAYFRLLQETIEYFKDPKREIKRPQGTFFHGKAYIAANPSFKELRYGTGVVGSSNFTYGGLVSNRELNMLNTDREAVQELIDWFEKNWLKSDDYKDEFIKYLSNYITTHSPYEVVAKALYETFKSNLEAEPNETLKSLYPHQILSYRDASRKLEAHGGVVIADATGLGKTRTTISLALEAIRNEKKVLLIAPKSILDTTWMDEMKKTIGTFIPCISTEKVSSNPETLETEHPEADFIIVDEAHYFRRPDTNRYQALRDHILKTEAQVVLVTATPVNNSLMDLYQLMALYLKEDAIEDITTLTLRDYFTVNQKRWLNKEKINMEPVLQRFIVRHSRELAKALDTRNIIEFPERILDDDPRSRYEADLQYQRIEDLLDKMKFMAYDLSIDLIGGQPRAPGGALISKTVERQQKEYLKTLIKILVKINYFKRLESSLEAFKDSLTRLKKYMELASRYADEHKVFTPPLLRTDLLYMASDLDEEDEMPSPEELFSKPKYKRHLENLRLTDQQVRDFKSSCRRDITLIRQILRLVPSKDKKYLEFIERVKDLVENVKQVYGNGIIIFTQYTTTADYLFSRLCEENLGVEVMMTTGSTCCYFDGSKGAKPEIIQKFQESGGILVSTDVLSAGQNLQNAQYVVNYDFPWNPVVLIQRIGRIDRMGSKHKNVYVINMLPSNGDPDDPNSLEYFLGLMSKLYLRLEAIKETIGLDATTLGEEVESKDFGIQEAIARNDPSALYALERELEQFTRSPMDTLATILKDRGLKWITSLPRGIGAYKQGKDQGLFILFTDGEDYYWRLKWDKKNGYVTSPSEIINLILEGENSNKGEFINYEVLIEKMKSMKQDLASELDAAIRRKRTLEGMAHRPTRAIKDIYDELAQHDPDGEQLALLFRKNSTRRTMVRALTKAMNEGILIEKARELLYRKYDTQEEEEDEEKEVNLKRICWCWITL